MDRSSNRSDMAAKGPDVSVIAMSEALLNTCAGRRRRTVACAIGIAAVVVAAASVGWFGARGFSDRVAAEVRAGVPAGSSRAEAEAWLKHRYGTIPFYNDDVTADRFTGRTVPELAGVPPDELGGLIRTTVARRGVFGDAVNLFDREQVWVYLLLDRDQRVQSYFFLSLGELREMEAARR
jgi:hypothetical protein